MSMSPSTSPSTKNTPPTSTQTAGDNSAGVVKRRACDECRTRKVACTKEPGGCSRCLREGMKCVYSAQKQMGRPRKRRMVAADEDEEENGSREAVPVSRGGCPSSASFPTADLPATQALGESDLLFGKDFGMPAVPEDQFPLEQLPQPFYGLDELSGCGHDHGQAVDPYLSAGDFPASGAGFTMDGDDVLAGIDFDTAPAWTPAGSLLPASNFDDQDFFALAASHGSFDPTPAHQVPPPLTEDASPTSSHYTNTGPSSSSASSAVPPNGNVEARAADVAPANPAKVQSLSHKTCPCLSRIYLSLDALSRLPDNVTEAMRTARTAAKAAHDTCLCPICSLTCFEDPTATPSIQSWQNMQLLGVLVPTTINAYVTILEMIDATAEQAARSRENLFFRFNEYGGLWGECGGDQHGCHYLSSGQLDRKKLRPEEWRVMTRTLLRLDIYGTDVEEGRHADGTSRKRRHWGLKDVIASMEERSDERHKQIDALVAAGHPHPVKHGPLHLFVPPGADDKRREDRQCLKIVEVARSALDKLTLA